MILDKAILGKKAKELGFPRDTLEKVYRLAEILKFMGDDEILSQGLALKGGTSINLTIFDLPRLSVDIDLDYCRSIDRGKMLIDRKAITDKFNKYMTANGYTLSAKSKNHYALDSLVYEYVNSGGVKDNLKIEINYMLRCHVLPVEKRKVNLPWEDDTFTVLSVAPVEIFATKTVALLTRTASRDLYDMYNMVQQKLFNEVDKEMFRKCVVFYSAISTEHPPKEFEFNIVGKISQQQIKRDLYPVLQLGSGFQLESAQEEVKKYLEKILIPTVNEKQFWNDFSNGVYKPELIFETEKELLNIKEHPMALWKCRDKKISE